ncbi:MAG: alpha/beta hydrolase [Deltaproteobacteria bacterium]|nr:alpha/beta hydrolase [Deltaproteobacteria bacterium]NNK06452.1 alpha/beta hydrolase [Myxococcales bacterium]
MTSAPALPASSLRFDLPNGMSIAADAYGDPGHQPVLFLHGGGQTRHAWGNSAELLAQHGFYTVCMDHRGHGESSWAGLGEYRVYNFAEDLQHVIAQLDQKPILVGASLGGIASLLAETEQDASVAKAVILVDVTPRLETDGVDRILGFMREGTSGFDSLEEVADSIAAYLPHRKRPKDLSGLAKNLRRMEDGRYYWHWDPNMLKTWEPGRYTEENDRKLKERLQEVRKIEVPVLLIRGRLSDLVSKETAAEFLQMVPHAEYVDLVDAHHMVAGDRNDAFTESVKEFLLRHFAPANGPSEPRARGTSRS